MIEPSMFVSWAIFVGGFVLPVLHVVFGGRAGPWTPPAGSRCPLGPRLGWLVLTLILGPVGWLMFLRGTAARRSADESRSD